MKDGRSFLLGVEHFADFYFRSLPYLVGTRNWKDSILWEFLFSKHVVVGRAILVLSKQVVGRE